MSAGPGSALGGPRAGSVQIAGSAVVVGTARLGEGSILAEGAVIRSEDTGVEVGTGSAVLENSVIVGNAVIPTVIGRRSVFGHLCTVIGAVAGDLCDAAERRRRRRAAGADHPVRLRRRSPPPRRAARRRPLRPAPHGHHRRTDPGASTSTRSLPLPSGPRSRWRSGAAHPSPRPFGRPEHRQPNDARRASSEEVTLSPNPQRSGLASGGSLPAGRLANKGPSRREHPICFRGYSR